MQLNKFEIQARMLSGKLSVSEVKYSRCLVKINAGLMSYVSARINEAGITYQQSLKTRWVIIASLCGSMTYNFIKSGNGIVFNWVLAGILMVAFISVYYIMILIFSKGKRQSELNYVKLLVAETLKNNEYFALEERALREEIERRHGKADKT